MQNEIFVNKIEDNQIKASIIVPIFRWTKNLEVCIDSLLAQTFDKIEIIITDFGCFLDVFKSIEKYLKNKKIVYLKLKNTSKEEALKRALKFSRGEYITFLNPNDFVDEDYLSLLLKSAIKYNADIVASNIVRKYELLDKWRVNFIKNSLILKKQEQFNSLNFPKQAYIVGKLYKKSLIKEIDSFDNINFLFNCILNCNKLYLNSNVNYYYCKHQDKKEPNLVKEKYINQKEALKKIIKNNIKLKRCEYFITKKIYKVFCFPLLKIKEDTYSNKVLFLFLNFLPVSYIQKNLLADFKIFLRRLFSISKIDSHILIMFLFIKFNIKYETKVVADEINENLLNKEKRDRKIIASLTTFPERINTVKTTIKTLMNQSVKADEIVLYLGDEQFPNKENDLPLDLLKLKDFGLQIKWVNDIKSYKKLIPALKEYPNDIIITFDDDIYYEKDTIEVLYNAYLKNPNVIQAHRTRRLTVKGDKIKPLNIAYSFWNEEEYKEPSFLNVLIGCGGVLYPPHSLYKDVLDEEKFKRILKTQDDVWFYAMAVLAGTKINLNKGYSYNHVTVENTQQYGLCKINNNKSEGLSLAEGLKKIQEEYPEIIEVLKTSL